MHDLILFDLDGTISDPLIGIGRSINHALVHYGLAPLELAAVGAYIGPPLDETFAKITGISAQPQLAELVSKYRERYADVGYAENVLYPGVPAALQQLSSLNMPLAVCTSKRVDFAEQILAMFDLRSHFRFVSGGEIGVHKWQQIQMLAATAAVTNAAVMVGDRAVDMIAAQRNGLSAAGVLWGHGSRAELTAERPRYLFDDPAELATLAS